MNVVLHSVYGLFLLLWAAVSCGFFLSFLYLLLGIITYIPGVVKCKRFPKYRDFCNCIYAKKNAKILFFIVDILISIISILSFLSITFLYNSGIFRLIPLIVMFLAFGLGVFINHRVLKNLPQSLLLFLLKWCIGLVLYPFILISKTIIKIIYSISEKRRKIKFQKSMQKYTSYRFNNIEKDAAYGLLDEYYKEFIK